MTEIGMRNVAINGLDGTLVKVMAWYDNEWGFTHQMVREARSLLGLQDAA
jgi:glyceraldehyde 3-phosphate dehydrogenase